MYNHRIVITVNPFICPTSKPSVVINRVFSWIISKYFESYFLILSILSSKAFWINSLVTNFCLLSFAQVEASPTISPISLNFVESFVLSSASLEENSTILAVASLSRGNKFSFSQKLQEVPTNNQPW